MKLITMNSDIVLAVRASHLEGKALTSLKDELQFLTRTGRTLVLDLSAVETATADSTRVLLDANTRIRKTGGSLKLVGIRNKVAVLFELLRVPRHIEMHPMNNAPVVLPMAA